MFTTPTSNGHSSSTTKNGARSYRAAHLPVFTRFLLPTTLLRRRISPTWLRRSTRATRSWFRIRRLAQRSRLQSPRTDLFQDSRSRKRGQGEPAGSRGASIHVDGSNPEGERLRRLAFDVFEAADKSTRRPVPDRPQHQRQMATVWPLHWRLGEPDLRHIHVERRQLSDGRLEFQQSFVEFGHQADRFIDSECAG